METQKMGMGCNPKTPKQLSIEQTQFTVKAIEELEKKLEPREDEKGSMIPYLNGRLLYFKEKLEGFKRSFILGEDGVFIEDIMRLEDQKVSCHVKLTTELHKKIEEKDKEIERLKSRIEYLTEYSRNLENKINSKEYKEEQAVGDTKELKDEIVEIKERLLELVANTLFDEENPITQKKTELRDKLATKYEILIQKLERDLRLKNSYIEQVLILIQKTLNTIKI